MCSSKASPSQNPIQQGEGRTISLSVSVEAVEQFQVETSGTGVEFNGQGSRELYDQIGREPVSRLGVRVLTKYRPRRAGILPAIRPVEHQNEFGATIGGPILKKKLFFFFSYDGGAIGGQSHTVRLLTDAQRAGGRFQRIAGAIYDPQTTVAVPGGFSRTQFSDPTRATTANPLGLNIIPLNRLSAISKVYQSLLPAPTNAALQNNYLGSVPVAYNNDSFNAKADYNLNQNQRLSGVFTHGKRSQRAIQRDQLRHPSDCFPVTVHGERARLKKSRPCSN